MTVFFKTFASMLLFGLYGLLCYWIVEVSKYNIEYSDISALSVITTLTIVIIDVLRRADSVNTILKWIVLILWTALALIIIGIANLPLWLSPVPIIVFLLFLTIVTLPKEE